MDVMSTGAESQVASRTMALKYINDDHCLADYFTNRVWN